MDVKYRYVRKYRDRHGKLRIEYRRKGKIIPLRGAPGTAEFQDAYDTASAMFTARETTSARIASNAVPASGTLGWLSVQYLASAECRQLAPSTQRTRSLVLQEMLAEPLRPDAATKFCDCPIIRTSPVHVKVLRDRKPGLPAAANYRVKLLRMLFKWAIENNIGGVSQNPARDIGKLKMREDGYHTWTPEEREQFEERHPIGTRARLAYALIFHTGQRRSDVVLLGRQHVHQGCLRFTQQKNRRRKPVSLELPILAELQRVLSASELGELTFLVNDIGRPFTVAGFGNWFRDRCNEAGLPHCTAHGLRKAAATVAAENGATAHELMSIFGWRSLEEAQRYTRAADRKGLAERGMQRLVPIKRGTRTV